MLWFASQSAENGGNGSIDEQNPTPRRKRGVLLVNTGTPEKPEAPEVRTYLREFLGDPMVIKLPWAMRWMQGFLAGMIARRRSPHSAEKYRRVWTPQGSPLKVIMEAQAAGLRELLPNDWEVFLAMRYGQPSIENVLRQVRDARIEEVVVVPLYPHYSRTTTGTVIQELYRAIKRVSPHLNVTARTTYYDDIGYVLAQARLIADYTFEHQLTPNDTHLLFSAHGLPVSYIKAGDPYVGHIQRSVKLIVERLGWPADRCSLSYQSRMGPSEWLQPYTDDTLKTLAAGNDKQVLVCPISFTVDCLESLEEIDLGYREQFEALGGKLYLCPALNSYGPFLAAMKNLVIHGPKAMDDSFDEPPLLNFKTTQAKAAEEDAEEDPALSRLVMIGASLKNRVGPGNGPELRYAEPNELVCAKKPQDDVFELLKQFRQRGAIDEAFVWNTCQRFEFYGWLNAPDEGAGRACVVREIREQLFAKESDDLGVNVLFGTDAWHHLMRTIAGLNSGLPGDRDVVEQFQTAFRLADRAGTAGPRASKLVDQAVDLAHAVRAETAWGKHDPGYCYAALKRLEDAHGLTFAGQQHCVIGGSTTSRSVLETLFESFDVHDRQMAFVYRSHHGGQMKLLRKAVRNGKRVRVDNYKQPAALAAIAEADVVYYGIDYDEPVLDADLLRGLRDFGERPLTIVDFNTFGSTRGLHAIPDVTVIDAQKLEEEVNAYAQAMLDDAEFAPAIDQAESWIKHRTPPPVMPELALPCMKDGQQQPARCERCGKHVLVGVKEETA